MPFDIEDYSREPGSKAILALRIVAWLELVGGIVGAILVWSSMVPEATLEEKTASIIIGSTFLAAGVVLCPLFLVISSMAENLIEIRQNSQK